MISTGIITFGLGGDNTTLILGMNHLGFEILVEEISTGGIGGGGGIEPEDKKEIRITIKYKNNVWKKIYIRGKKKSGIVIKILKVGVSITTAISVKVRNLRKLLNTITIKRK